MAGKLMHPREGDEDLSEGSKSDPSAAGRDKRAKARKPNSGSRPKGGDLGKALRSVYDTTLREDIPSDFLDLLGKLN
jgi:Anti-sigma factor NepR